MAVLNLGCCRGSKRGMTLVEVMVAIVLLLVGIGASTEVIYRISVAREEIRSRLVAMGDVERAAAAAMAYTGNNEELGFYFEALFEDMPDIDITIRDDNKTDEPVDADTALVRVTAAKSFESAVTPGIPVKAEITFLRYNPVED